MTIWLEQLWLRLRYRDDRARACESIRRSLAALGVPADTSDDEIRLACERATHIMRHVGISVAEADRAFRACAVAVGGVALRTDE
jgi:hypothetical protein